MRLQAKSKIAQLSAQLEESKKVATDVLEKVCNDVSILMSM
jgi:hypothetical protein